MRNFLFNYFRYRDSNQVMINIDCDRIKGSFDQESLKNTYTGPVKLRNCLVLIIIYYYYYYYY